MESDELTEWMAYAQLDPFGGIRGDYQTAMMTSNLMNAQVGESKFKLTDFLLRFGPKRTADKYAAGIEMREKVRAMFSGRKR